MVPSETKQHFFFVIFDSAFLWVIAKKVNSNYRTTGFISHYQQPNNFISIIHPGIKPIIPLPVELFSKQEHLEEGNDGYSLEEHSFSLPFSQSHVLWGLVGIYVQHTKRGEHVVLLSHLGGEIIDMDFHGLFVWHLNIQNVLTLYMINFQRKHKHLQSISFLYTVYVRVVKILPHIRKGPTYFT